MTSTEKNHTSNQTSTCPLTQHTPGSCASRCVLWRTALLPSQTHTPTFPLQPGENLCSERVESYRWSPECTHHCISAGPLAHLHCFTITCLSINTYITTRQCISSEGTCIIAGILPGWHNLKIPVVRGDQEVRGYWHLMMTHRDTYNRYRQSASTLNMSSISLINLSWGLHLSLSPLHTHLPPYVGPGGPAGPGGPRGPGRPCPEGPGRPWGPTGPWGPTMDSPFGPCRIMYTEKFSWECLAAF